MNGGVDVRSRSVTISPAVGTPPSQLSGSDQLSPCPPTHSEPDAERALVPMMTTIQNATRACSDPLRECMPIPPTTVSRLTRDLSKLFARPDSEIERKLKGKTRRRPPGFGI